MPNPASSNSGGSSPKFGLHYDPWGRLVMIDAEGVRHVGVEPVRAFPVADPQHWVSICNAEGREIACLYDLNSLPESVRRILEDELRRREFAPVIQRIVKAATESEPNEWTVETDRGPTTFLVDNAEAVRRVGPDQAMVTDVQGVRDMIASIEWLNPASRRVLEHYF